MIKLKSVIFLFGFVFMIFSCAQLKEPENDDENNDIHHATPIVSFPFAESGFVNHADDEDYYLIEATSGQRVFLNLSVPSGRNYELFFLKNNESVIDSSTNGSGEIESIANTVTQSGSFYVKIISGDGSYSTDLPYRLTVYITDSSGVPGFASPHLVLGNPSLAAPVVDSVRNYLMEKTQYALSYDNTTSRPNWVSWQLNSAWVGNVARQEDFRSDESLPAAWYHVDANDFDNSGYDRGHMCPSGDRTATESDNSETFLMTNMIAQAPDNNQGPWADLENYCRGLVAEGDELFIISGGYGSNGTVASGHVSVPTRTWKIIVVLNEPSGGFASVTSATRVIAVDMPNVNGIRNANWKNYRVSVDQLEAATGYDFMSNVSTSIQSSIESTVDTQ